MTTRHEALNAPSADGARQLFIVHDVVWEAFVHFVYDKGLSIEPMPAFTDTVPTPPGEEPPTFFVGLGIRP